MMLGERIAAMRRVIFAAAIIVLLAVPSAVRAQSWGFPGLSAARHRRRSIAGRAGGHCSLFAFAGLGATFFSAIDLPSETKLSWGLGGGVKYFPWNGLGFRAHFRYKPTMLDDEDAGNFCDPFGFCQDTLQQIEIVAGGVVRF